MLGTAAVAALAVVAAHTDAGSSTTASNLTTFVADIVERDSHHDRHTHSHIHLDIHLDRVVLALHGLRELRELILSEYRQRRLMTLGAYRGSALGTSMHVVVTDPRDLDAATAAVQEVVAAIDSACSRFREDSELSRFQAGEGRKEGVVSPLLAQALATALRAAELTGGAVDPTVGEAVRNAGYDVDFDAWPPTARRSRSPYAPCPDGGGSGSIRRPGAWRSMPASRWTSAQLPRRLPPTSAAAAARAAIGRGGVLVSLGGDVSVAGDPPEEGWHIQIAEDSRAAITPDGETIADPRRRGRHVEHDRPALAAWRRRAAPHHRPVHRAPRGRPVANRERCRGQLRRRQHRRHRGDRPRRMRSAWLDGARLPARLVDRARRDDSRWRVAAARRSDVLSDQRLHLALVPMRVVVDAMARDARIALVVAGEGGGDVVLSAWSSDGAAAWNRR